MLEKDASSIVLACVMGYGVILGVVLQTDAIANVVRALIVGEGIIVGFFEVDTIDVVIGANVIGNYVSV